MRRFSHLVLAVYGALASMGTYADPLASTARRVGFSPAFAAPYGYTSASIKARNVAKHKRASIKARNVAKHRRTT